MENIIFKAPEGQTPAENNLSHPGGAPPEHNQASSGDGNNSALHFFLYLVNFLSLSFVATGLGTILYQLINKNFPETTLSYANYFQQGAIKFGLASIIIATPVFFTLSFLITKYIFEGKIAEDSKVRKWTTYIILFFTASTILGDLIALVYNWLGGDIAARFILKILVVLAIAGVIFGYYFWDMRKRNMAGVSYLGNKVFGSASLAVIVLVFISSFFIIDSPAQTRNKKIDSQTINYMQNYVGEVESYYRENNKLPDSGADIEVDGYYAKMQDKSNPIVFSKTGALTYELCANFKRSNKNDNDDNLNVYDYDSAKKEWQHDAGKVCFDKEIKNKIQSSIDRSTDASLIPSPEQMAEARRRAQIASVKSTMSSTVPVAIICRDGDGAVTSGDGGADACVGSAGMDYSSTKWPNISQCGPDPDDTKWIVMNGENEKWDITLSCANFPSCNGPANAICNEEGCDFGGTCQ